MTYLARNITFDSRLKVFVITAVIDGENEDLTFSTLDAASAEYTKLRGNGAQIMPLEWDETS